MTGVRVRRRDPHTPVKTKQSMSQEPTMATTRPVALVTGASSGIGKAAALALVAAGHEVVGTSRNTAQVTPSRA